LKRKSNINVNVNEGDIDVENIIEEGDTWNRTWCQTLCCDFVLPNEAESKGGSFTFRTMLGFLVGIYIFLSLLRIGSSLRITYKPSKDTSEYLLLTSCAPLDRADTSMLRDLPTADAAHFGGLTVAHCGACASVQPCWISRRCGNKRDDFGWLYQPRNAAQRLYLKVHQLVECLRIGIDSPMSAHM
jgi:hypothetical protein